MIDQILVPVAVIIALVAVNGVFVAAEFSLVASRAPRLATLAEGGSRGARWLVDLIERPMGKDAYIAVAQLGITLASVGLGMYGEPVVASWLTGPFQDWGLSSAAAHTVAFVVALSGITYLHVVLGEMVPKALALQAPEQVSVSVNPVMRAFAVIFRPMVAVLNATAFGLMRLLRIPDPDQRTALYTSAELAIVTDEAAQGGALGPLQRDLIHNVFELGAHTAAELMTPRERLVTVELDTDVAGLEELLEHSPLSRYPVTDGGLDRVVGLLHIKDFIRANQRGTATDVPALMRPIPVVPAAASAEVVLERIRRKRTHACLVVDEAGTTLGLVTLDDVIAQIMEDEVLEHEVAAARQTLRGAREEAASPQEQ